MDVPGVLFFILVSKKPHPIITNISIYIQSTFLNAPTLQQVKRFLYVGMLLGEGGQGTTCLLR